MMGNENTGSTACPKLCARLLLWHNQAPVAKVRFHGELFPIEAHEVRRLGGRSGWVGVWVGLRNELEKRTY